MTEPIRVLQVVASLNAGGMENYIMNLYRMVDKSKVQFDFVVHHAAVGLYEDEIQELGGKIYHFTVLDDKNVVKYISELNRFFDEHKEYQIIHGHLSSLAVFYLGVAKKYNVPWRIAHSHGAGFLHALLIGLILILILKKSKINDTWIMLIGVVFFIAGIFVQKQLDVASVNGYAGFWKLYYMIWGKTIKNGVFMGMFYCMLGTLIQKIPQTKTVFICTISAFILYVVGVYFQYEWRKLLLPVVLVLVVESVIMLPLHIGSLGKWFRSMSTLLFLCHYIFVRAFECFPTLAVCFPEGIHKFMFVGVSAFLLSALLVWAGNKNKRIRWLWQ